MHASPSRIANYHVIIKAVVHDQFLTVLSFNFVQLVVNLTDVNDNAPQFSNVLPLSIEENRIPGSQVTVVTATDADRGTNSALSYSIIGGDPTGRVATRITLMIRLMAW